MTGSTTSIFCLLRVAAAVGVLHLLVVDDGDVDKKEEKQQDALDHTQGFFRQKVVIKAKPEDYEKHVAAV